MKGKIFNAQEVQAIMSGNKTMFREVIKVQPANENQVFATVASSIRNKDIGTHNFINPKATWEQTKKFKCPYQVGQKIFVKESFCKSYKDEEKEIRGFGGKEVVVKWKPAQHMKQEYSRLTLLIKEIRVEKLDSITPFDCVCEGVWDGRNVMLGMSGKAIEAFKDAWNATHKKPEEKFEASPFVWVFSFEVVK